MIRSDTTMVPARFRIVEAPVDTEFDAEHRLLTAISRRRPGQAQPVERVVTVRARGRLGDGRWLWSGDDLTWGAIAVSEARDLGWDLDATATTRATVRSDGATHRILRVHHLRVISRKAGGPASH
ncbi:MAG: hypothetical protein ACO35E_08670 [Ilumatobacteraceae bacterium]|jgi:hypothetical protein